MCDPLTISGLALTAGSVVANSMAQSAIQSARNDAMGAERIRQQGYDNEADTLNTQSRERYDDFEGQQSGKAQQLSDFYQGSSVGSDVQDSVLPSSSSNIVVREEAKQREQAKEYTDQQAVALGGLRSFGDVLSDISRGQARDAGSIGQIGGFKRGSNGVLSYELEDANNAGSGMKLFADILGGAGSVTTTAGLGGGSLFGVGSAQPVNLMGPTAATRPNSLLGFFGG